MLGVMVVFLVAGVWRLAQLQIVQGEYYRERSERRLIRAQTIVAPRGEILDRYGRPLVTNRQGFFIRFQRIDVPRAERAAVNNELNFAINNLIPIAREENLTFAQAFPISGPPFMFDFPTDDLEQENQLRLSFLSANNLGSAMTADEVITHFQRRYAIADIYTQEELRDIIAVRYEMELRRFSSSVPFTFAADVDMRMVQRVREMSMDLPGVFVDIEPIREYTSGNLAAHVLGHTGLIQQEEFERLREAGYTVGMNDIIGRAGMERVLESDLRGVDGRRSIEQTRAGVTAQVLETVAPISGNYAVLTIDKRVQEAAERALEQTIYDIRARSRWDGRGRGRDAYSGAAVAICVNTGQVLAMATWPTYDPARFNEDFAEMNIDPLRPMFNRALMGTFAPGSTYKMAPALAALETGLITNTSRIGCGGGFTRQGLGGHVFNCMGVHGSLNVAQALSVSCNVFFYDIGWRMGVDTMSYFSRQLGFGQLTGIELPESRGILASREHVEAQGRSWMAGNTPQAAIGQTYHLHTPAQLASFMATIANGGTRYRLHLTKEIRDSETNEIVRRVEPYVLENVQMSSESHAAIMEGMRQATIWGTARGGFAGFPISTGGKTGTAETPGPGGSNGLFVGFAPFDNPQIAVAVVIEGGSAGSWTIPVAREIFSAYFRLDEPDEDVIAVPRNVLLR